MKNFFKKYKFYIAIFLILFIIITINVGIVLKTQNADILKDDKNITTIKYSNKENKSLKNEINDFEVHSNTENTPENISNINYNFQETYIENNAVVDTIEQTVANAISYVQLYIINNYLSLLNDTGMTQEQIKNIIKEYNLSLERKQGYDNYFKKINVNNEALKEIANKWQEVSIEIDKISQAITNDTIDFEKINNIELQEKLNQLHIILQ